MALRLLILSVTVGNGHMRAAEALKAAARAAEPQGAVEILDTFRYASPFLDRTLFGAYLQMLKHNPASFALLYNASEPNNQLAGWGKKTFDRLLNLFTAPKLGRYIQEFQPDAIYCTHPFPAGIATQLRTEGYFRGPVVVTITDYSLHYFWLAPNVDYYLVGAEAMLSQGEAYNLPPGKMRATGIPIDAAFAEKYDRRALRAGFDLAPEQPVALLTGGGLGLGGLETAVRAISETVPGCQQLVIAGANEELRTRLEGLAAELSGTIRVHGFVHNMPHFMAAADLMVGKPGGLTCAEALARSLPLLMVDPLPGQEERNANFVAENGAGFKVSQQELPQKLKECLEDEAALTAMTKAAAALGKPNAARDAINLITEEVAGEQSSPP